MSQKMANQGEIAFAFKCQGDDLIGFLHQADQRRDIGVLTLVAGGPQYRGGVGRQLVSLGRRLSREGIAVMRFDHRGLGDSEGNYKGFRFIEDDIAAAIDAFKARAPHVRRLILWGGCDSATAALMNAHKFPDVICVIAGNPFVSSAATAAKATRKHYFSRLRQVSFWTKLARGKYRIGDYATAAWRKFFTRIHKTDNSHPGQQIGKGSGSFVDDLLRGLRHFDGKVLFLMGDRFLRSDEFDALIVSSPEWRSIYGKATHERIDIKGGDQVFSTRESQERLFDVASQWIHRNFPGESMVEESIHPPIQSASP